MSATLESLRMKWIEDGEAALTLGDLDETLWPAGNGAIYGIRSPSAKWYVGQTRQALRARWMQHGQPARIACKLIHRAFAKYGVRRMELWVLQYNVPLDQLNDREKHFIATFNTRVPEGRGYNLSAGGEESPMHNPEVVARSRASHLEWWAKPEHRQKMSAIRKSSPKLLAHCAKMRASKPKPQYWMMPRAEALRKLKACRLNTKQRAERKGEPYDLTAWNAQIAEHEARHKEEFYSMEWQDAVKVLRRNRNCMAKWWARKNVPFHNEWWYDDQIEAHLARRTS